jgi:hypothetical protein
MNSGLKNKIAYNDFKNRALQSKKPSYKAIYFKGFEWLESKLFSDIAGS